MAEDAAVISAGKEGDGRGATFQRIHLNAERATATKSGKGASGKRELG